MSESLVIVIGSALNPTKARHPSVLIRQTNASARRSAICVALTADLPVTATAIGSDGETRLVVSSISIEDLAQLALDRSAA